MDKDTKLDEILKRTQPQSLLDHLIGETRDIQNKAKSLEEILVELHSQQSQSFADAIVKGSSEQN